MGMNEWVKHYTWEFPHTGKGRVLEIHISKHTEYQMNTFSLQLFLFQTYGVLPYFANVRLVAEFSTPFVNQRWAKQFISYIVENSADEFICIHTIYRLDADVGKGKTKWTMKNTKEQRKQINRKSTKMWRKEKRIEVYNYMHNSVHIFSWSSF